MTGNRAILRPILIAGAGLAGIALAAQTANADAVADFYKGKTITLTTGTSPGGSFQVYGQLFTEHMKQYIPGNPTIVMNFMPGAGGTKAANYLYAAAAQDGSQMLLSHAIPLSEMLRPKGIKFKSAKFQWLGSFAAITQMLTLWHNAPVKTLEEAKKKEAILSSFAKTHLTYQWASLANNLVGTKFRIVTGYRGGAKNNIAMEQGEAHGWTPSWGNILGTKPQWLAEKKINILLLYAFERLPELPNVPTLIELAKPADKDIAEFMIASTPIARSIAVGPKVPADRVAALRDAFAKTVADKQFLADAKKRKLIIQIRKWEETTRLVNKIVSASPELLKRVKKATGQADK
jgi:tripartite-type tricarboxylate transporter receptor subunit TctC